MAKKEIDYIDEKIKALKDSPLYAMSLGNRELYHSNFWAWLMRRNPYMINVFFDKLIKKVEKKEDKKGEPVFNITTTEDDITHQNIDPMELIKREDSHTDILIQLGKKVYIIENKIKTLPDRKQLLKYQHKSEGFQKGCYTGFVDPDFKEELITFDYEKRESLMFEHSKWGFVSYTDISEKIKKYLNNREYDRFNDFETNIIKKYYEYIADLNYIMKEKISNDDMKIFKFESDERLESIRMDDTYKKLKANIISKDIFPKLKDILPELCKEETNNFKLKSEIGFSNNMPLFSFKYIYNNGYDDDRITDVYSFGVQIQGNNIRRYVETEKGVLQKYGYDKAFQKFAETGWFDKNYEKGQQISLNFYEGTRSYNTNMSPRKDKKKKKDSITYNAFTDFVHQHYTIDDNDLSNIETLIENIKDNLVYAHTILDKAEEAFIEIKK